MATWGMGGWGNGDEWGGWGRVGRGVENEEERSRWRGEGVRRGRRTGRCGGDGERENRVRAEKGDRESVGNGEESLGRMGNRECV